MRFADFIRKLAIVLFIIVIIGSFPIAKKLSTTITITEYKYTSDLTDKKTDKVEYISVLLGLWISSGIVCIFLYGLGEILEYLYIIKKSITNPDRINEKPNISTLQDKSNNKWTMPTFSNEENNPDKNFWKCTNCGKSNSLSVGTCGCGTSRKDSLGTRT